MPACRHRPLVVRPALGEQGLNQRLFVVADYGRVSDSRQKQPALQRDWLGGVITPLLPDHTALEVSPPWDPITPVAAIGYNLDVALVRHYPGYFPREAGAGHIVPLPSSEQAGLIVEPVFDETRPTPFPVKLGKEVRRGGLNKSRLAIRRDFHCEVADLAGFLPVLVPAETVPPPGWYREMLPRGSNLKVREKLPDIGRLYDDRIRGPTGL